MAQILVWLKQLYCRFFILTEFCKDCGGQVGLVWTATDDLWFKVRGESQGILCIDCFDHRARKREIYLRWTPGPL